MNGPGQHCWPPLLNSSEDAIIGETLEGVITSWNRAAESMYGYSAEEIIGKPVLALLPHDRMAEMDELLAKIRKGHRVDHYETLRRRRDGSLLHVSLSLSPIHDSSGRLIGASSIARDISERKRIDEQMLATSKYARSLIEASLDPLVTISPEGKITDVNEATVKVTGIPREKLIGTDFSDYFTEPKNAREGYRRVFSQGLSPTTRLPSGTRMDESPTFSTMHRFTGTCRETFWAFSPQHAM